MASEWRARALTLFVILTHPHYAIKAAWSALRNRNGADDAE